MQALQKYLCVSPVETGVLVTARYVFCSAPGTNSEALKRCTNSLVFAVMRTPSVHVSSRCVMCSGSSLPMACHQASDVKL